MEFLELFCISLGATVVVYFAVKLLLFSRMLFTKWCFPLPKTFFTSKGEWAVVTGSSEGIGRAYAFALAKEGMNVVILSRTKASLDRVAKEIGNATGQKVKVIVADFTKDNVFSEIEDQLKDLSVGVLVNNVGIIPSIFPSKLLECADLEQTITRVINCNVKTVVKMCKIILPGMENRGKGVILNISSGFASVPVPYYILYSASKAFIERFSQGLQAEYRDKGIIIQVVAPFGVSTRMTFYQKASVTVLTSEDFVKSSLQYLRAGDKTNGSVCHIIMAWLLRFIPFEVIYTERVLQGINNYIMKRVEEPISASNATLENGRTNQG